MPLPRNSSCVAVSAASPLARQSGALQQEISDTGSKTAPAKPGVFFVVVLIYLKLFGITWEEATIKTHIQLWCL